MYKMGIVLFMSFLLVTFLATNKVHAESKILTFDCVSTGESGFIWKYKWEFNENGTLGVVEGYTMGGKFYTNSVSGKLTVSKLFITNDEENSLGERSKGWIDRKSLKFHYGGSDGSCTLSVTKGSMNKF